MSKNWEYKKYKVVEEYLGEDIIINVDETWTEDGIETAGISCSYNPILRTLGHSIGKYKQSESGIVQGEIVKRLSVDDVHDAIFKEIYIAEKNIARSKKEEHDNFKLPRSLTVFVEYENQDIQVRLWLSAIDTGVWILRLNSLISYVSIDKFRDNVIEEVQRGKMMIDNGYVFPKPSAFSKVKRKIQKMFYY